MKFKGLRRLAAVLLAVAMAAALPSGFAFADSGSSGSALTVGAGSCKIEFTHEVFASNVDGFNTDADTNVESYPYARVLLLEDGEQAAIVSLELCNTPSDVIELIQQYISEKTGMSADNVWVHSNHTITTPHAPSDETERAAFVDCIMTAVKAAVDQAVASKTKATMTVAQGNYDLNLNRDMTIEGLAAYGGLSRGNDGSGVTNPVLTVIRFNDESGNPIGIYYNYGIKPTCIDNVGKSSNTRRISSDVTGMAALAAEEAYGCPVMFVMPAAGDQIPYDEGYGCEYDAEKNKINQVEVMTLDEAIALKNEIGAKLTDAVKEVIEKAAAEGDKIENTAIKAGKTSYEWPSNDGTTTITMPVSAITIGDEEGVGFVGFKPEMNAITELSLWSASPCKYTLLTSFLNGDGKYMPDAASYPNESNNNVGTWEYSRTGFAEGCAEKMVETGAALLQSLLDGTYEDGGSSGTDKGSYLGGTVSLGGYSWTILAKQDGKQLILCDNIIRTLPYNDEDEDVTWETSSIREYLNGEFYDAFTDAEKARIIKTTISNAVNVQYGISGGADTEDNVFLLSLTEAGAYLDGTDLIQVKDAQGNNVYWYLRSPGERTSTAAGVTASGLIDYHGPEQGAVTEEGIRPAMWILKEEETTEPESESETESETAETPSESESESESENPSESSEAITESSENESSDSGTENSGSNGSQKGTGATNTNVAKTGDDNALLWWILLAAAGAGGAAGALVWKVRKGRAAGKQ